MKLMEQIFNLMTELDCIDTTESCATPDGGVFKLKKLTRPIRFYIVYKSFDSGSHGYSYIADCEIRTQTIGEASSFRYGILEDNTEPLQAVKEALNTFSVIYMKSIENGETPSESWLITSSA